MRTRACVCVHVCDSALTTRMLRDDSLYGDGDVGEQTTNNSLQSLFNMKRAQRRAASPTE